MAKYKENWRNPLDSEVIGHTDTETGRFIQINSNNPFSEKFDEWVAAGGIPDPAYTAEEIAAYQAEQDRQEEIRIEQETVNIPAMTLAERQAFIDSYLDGIVAVPQLITALEELLRKMIVYI